MKRGKKKRSKSIQSILTVSWMTDGKEKENCQMQIHTDGETQHARKNHRRMWWDAASVQYPSIVTIHLCMVEIIQSAKSVYIVGAYLFCIEWGWNISVLAPPKRGEFFPESAEIEPWYILVHEFDRSEKGRLGHTNNLCLDGAEIESFSSFFSKNFFSPHERKSGGEKRGLACEVTLLSKCIWGKNMEWTRRCCCFLIFCALHNFPLFCHFLEKLGPFLRKM